VFSVCNRASKALTRGLANRTESLLSDTEVLLSMASLFKRILLGVIVIELLQSGLMWIFLGLPYLEHGTLPCFLRQRTTDFRSDSSQRKQGSTEISTGMSGPFGHGIDKMGHGH
jgi:hypothetical protein